MFSDDSYDRKVARLLTRLEIYLGVPKEEIRGIMRLSNRTYEKVLNGARSVGIDEFTRLSEAYGFSMDAFDQERIDFGALRALHLGNPAVIPERYQVGAFSRIRAVRNIVSFVQQKYDPSVADDLFSYFHFTEQSWADPDRPVSVYFVEDTLGYLRTRGFKDSDIFQIGKQSVAQAKGSSFAHALTRQKKLGPMYEAYFTEWIKLVEQNNQYRIQSLTEDTCVLESHERSDVLDTFGVKNVGGPQRCLYRAGALAASTQFLGLPDAHVVETRCVHRGDPICEFTIDFSWARLCEKTRSRYKPLHVVGAGGTYADH